MVDEMAGRHSSKTSLLKELQEMDGNIEMLHTMLFSTQYDGQNSFQECQTLASKKNCMIKNDSQYGMSLLPEFVCLL